MFLAIVIYILSRADIDQTKGFFPVINTVCMLLGFGIDVAIIIKLLN